MSRYDDVSHLLADLDMERRRRDKIEGDNADLEKTIVELESYLRHLDEVGTTGSAEDNEWKVRYECEKALDLHLQDYKAWLEAELGDTEWRLHTGSFPEAMNFNLDLLTEMELVRLVKHMERVKADYYNQVRDTEYKADCTTKEFHHFDDMRRCFKSDLKHATACVERMKMEEILERQAGAGTPPMFAPSYCRYLDAQPLASDYFITSPRASKSKRRSKSLSKDATRRSKSKSPGRRAKSRSDKNLSRSKNKDTEEIETNNDGDGGTEGEKSGEGDK